MWIDLKCCTHISAHWNFCVNVALKIAVNVTVKSTHPVDLDPVQWYVSVDHRVRELVYRKLVIVLSEIKVVQLHLKQATNLHLKMFDLFFLSYLLCDLQYGHLDFSWVSFPFLFLFLCLFISIFIPLTSISSPPKHLHITYFWQSFWSCEYLTEFMSSSPFPLPACNSYTPTPPFHTHPHPWLVLTLKVLPFHSRPHPWVVLTLKLPSSAMILSLTSCEGCRLRSPSTIPSSPALLSHIEFISTWKDVMKTKCYTDVAPEVDLRIIVFRQWNEARMLSIYSGFKILPC